jgi:hypothetical protein
VSAAQAHTSHALHVQPSVSVEPTHTIQHTPAYLKLPAVPVGLLLSPLIQTTKLLKARVAVAKFASSTERTPDGTPRS